MLPRGAEAGDWHLDMQLAGKLVLSAATLLLVTAAYRLYRSRPAPAPQGGRGARTEAQEEAEGSGQPAVTGTSPAARQKQLKRRRASRGAGTPHSCGWEDPEGPCVLATRATSRDEQAPRKGSGEQRGGQHGDPELVPPACCGQEAGTAIGGKPGPPLRSWLGCSVTGPAVAVDGDCVGGEPALWPDGGTPVHPASGQLEGPPGKGSSDMSWALACGTGVSGEEAGALQAASDLGLAVLQQQGAADASYTFSSRARVRVQESFVGGAEGPGPRLKGRVYDYYVEAASRAVSRPAPRTAALAEAASPEPVPGPLGTGTASGGQAGHPEGGAETAAPPGPAPPPSDHGSRRKESLSQIAENPALQLQLEGFGAPTPDPLDQGSLPPSPGGRGERVAGTRVVRIPRGPAAAPDIHLDLGNCYEVLTLAKRRGLEGLQEAAYRAMSDNYLQVLRSPHIYGRLSGAERELILQRRLQGHRCLVVADVCPQEGGGRLCCYDDAQDTWRPLAQLPPEAVSWGCAACTLFNYLFVVAGCQGHQPSSRVFCYNPLTGIWSEVCPLSQARPHCQLVALDGHLYAIGGECLNTVERYDPRQDRWAFAPPLPGDTFALAHTATACAGEIFVTGGTLRYQLLRFSAREQRWRSGPTGGSKDRTAEMVAVDGFLYRFDLHRSLGISVYRCSASTRLWYEVASHRTPHPEAFQCAVVDSRVYCVGRGRTLCFLADHLSPRFSPKEPRGFPSPRGTLLPTVLTLPAPGTPQTRV
ncbi:kelch domain-containing protein 7A [Sciurus carolinensis]|uniref:kelch domain-containing protein 7A n=1 Tax=Sciurus carolinensis TaxID=30640 RepID=UPI001FB2497D|nr:kelch domain-containing protein 7A [Sciurus carolinensis]